MTRTLETPVSVSREDREYYCTIYPSLMFNFHLFFLLNVLINQYKIMQLVEHSNVK